MSLIIPESFKIFRIMGIDPGLNNLGIALFDIEYQTRKILRLEAFTLVNDKLKDDSGLDLESHAERTVKLMKLRFALLNIMQMNNPFAVACESPFFNRLRPTAYAALVEVTRLIHTTVIDYNSNTIFRTVEPLLVKKHIGAGMETGKLDVKRAVSIRPELMSVLVNNLDRLDEHSVDAIAVGYTFLKTSGV